VQIYLVGGAVRDQLLGLPIKERDWVVVGATEDEMLAQGYIKVGKDFPVFLHPKTKEEYALARTERKTGKGYYGFACYAEPDVTLEQDLLRRDITINAMAQDDRGNIIDPYHGQDDLKQRLLRHVSPAFSEDPVRILRVARFAARFADLGFHVAEHTLILMREMVNNGEVDALVPERVWQEWQRALSAVQPVVFLEVLNDCGALARLFPQFSHDQTQLQKTREILRDTSTRTTDPLMRFAASVLYADSLEVLCAHLRVPNEYRELALLVQKHHLTIMQVHQPNEMLKLLSALDAWRRPERFQKILDTCKAMFPENLTAIQALLNAYSVTESIKPTEFVEQGLQGGAIQEALLQKRLQALITAT
jgi:tRNA nucleotidyltransferase (CCA-adding enzyme)